MMLTPETTEGAPRSRLQQEVTPNHTPSTPRSSQHAPGNLHFNSQQYRTPSSQNPHHQLHLRHHVSSPLCSTPPDAPMARVRVTPRAIPRNRRQWSTPSSSGSTSSCRSVSGTPGRSIIQTPNGILYNPFETDPEHMKGWILSPGLFATKAEAEKTNSPFWSIDHIAMMQPADIDETCLTKFLGATDQETEERAQLAIDQFFTNNDVILPSPWSEENSHKRPFQLPQTPVTPGIVQMAHPSVNSSSTKATPGQKSKEVCCQTALTLPMDFDLQKVLGKYYTHDPKDEGSPDPLSTSSLRRKLFFHGEESNPPSPVPDSNEEEKGPPMENNPSDLVLTPQSSKRSSNHTPGSNVFSSSPIHSDSDRGSTTPSLRRCSTAPELMASPSLSPIGSSQRRPARCSLAKDDVFLNENTPLCQPLHHTPSSGCPSLPFSSPGVSPIRLEISANNAMDTGSKGSHKKSSGTVKTSRVTLISPSSMQSEKVEHNDTSEIKYMEVDRDENDVLASSTGFRIVRGFNGFSDSGADQSGTDDQPAHSTHVAQDTGYQTNSLQSLHQDTGLHTNLTNQFGSLLPAFSRHDTGLEEDYNNMSSMECNFADSANMISSTRLTHPVNPDDESARDADFKRPSIRKTQEVPSANTSLNNKSSSKLDESLILRQARKALGRVNSEELGKKASDSTKLSRNGKETNVYASEIQSQWSVTVPTPLRKKLHQVGLIDQSLATGESQVMPSAVAMKAIKRAGQDYEFYCKPQTVIPADPPLIPADPPRRPSIIKKEILTPSFEDESFLAYGDTSFKIS